MREIIRYKLLIIMCLMFFTPAVFAYNTTNNIAKEKIENKTDLTQLPFIENKGQISNNEVGFYTRIFGGTLFIKKNGTLIYSLPCEDNGRVVIREVFTDEKIIVGGIDPSPTKISYFKGKDKTKWKNNIPAYRGVSFGEIHKNIHLKLNAYGNNVEKLFTLLPGANPEKIKIKVEGAKGLKVNNQGELVVLTELGSICFTEPFAYQKTGNKKKSVEVDYIILEENVYGFTVSSYNKKQPLIIDPLISSTFIGGDDQDTIPYITFDASGNIYVAGMTQSTNFPTTPGAYDESYDGGQHIFISKFDGTLSTLLASTFLFTGGGVSDIEVDLQEKLYALGYACTSEHMPDFPTTPGAYDESYNGGCDVFVSRFDSTLSNLEASTLIGGNSLDFYTSSSLFLDANENIYITGSTMSSDYPTTPGAYDESFNGGPVDYDIFVSKFDNNLTSLLASTFIGGDNRDESTSLALNGNGEVYIVGKTSSLLYPTTPGAYDQSFYGSGNIFVSKFDSTLSTLLASSFIGHGDYNRANAIITDSNDNVYLTGWASNSPPFFSFPTTPGAYNEDGDGVFVSKFDSNLGSLLASTFVGSGGGYSIELDSDGNVYVAGGTSSADYPTTLCAYDDDVNGSDGFISKLNNSLSTLLASTFIGGSGSDGLSSFLLINNHVYVAGPTESTDYPTTPGAFDNTWNGGTYDVYVSKLDKSLTYPDTDGDGIGDVCECEGNFDCDEDCDGTDASIFKDNFGRSSFNSPCSNSIPCNGDFDCDTDVDGTDATLFKSDFGRSPFLDPCPTCEFSECCVYL